jgi:5'-nucleotidase/UDP-sugar diphosphatase
MYLSNYTSRYPVTANVLRYQKTSQRIGQKALKFVYWNDLYDINRLAQFSTQLKGLLKRYPNLIGLFGGDVLAPSVESAITKGHHMIDGLNYITQTLKGCLVAVPGNHEFDFGVANFLNALKKSRFKWVLANVETNAQTKKSLPPYVVLNQKGVKTLVYGLTLQETFHNQPSELKIKSPFANAHKELTELKKQIRPDVTILLAHLGEPTYEDISKLPIDVAVVGHEHDKKMELKNGVTIVRADADLETFGLLHLQLRKRPPLWRRMMTLMHDTVHDRLPPPRVENVENQFITLPEDAPPDHDLISRLSPEIAVQAENLKEPLFELKKPLNVKKDAVRGGSESEIGNLITDAVLKEWNSQHPNSPADVALMHAGGIRGDKLYPANSMFTMRQHEEILPYPKAVALLSMKGKELRELLEWSLSHIYEDAILNKHSGYFFHFSGMHVKANLSKSFGNRIEEITISNQALESETLYKVLADAFIVSKEAGVPTLYNLPLERVRLDTTTLNGKTPKMHRDYVKDYYLNQKEQGATINPSIDGRWQITRQSK